MRNIVPCFDNMGRKSKFGHLRVTVKEEGYEVICSGVLEKRESVKEGTFFDYKIDKKVLPDYLSVVCGQF